MVDFQTLQRYFDELPRLQRLPQYRYVAQQLRLCKNGDQSVCERFITPAEMWSGFQQSEYQNCSPEALPQTSPNLSYFTPSPPPLNPPLVIKITPPPLAEPPTIKGPGLLAAEAIPAGLMLFYLGLVFVSAVDFAKYQRMLTEEQDFIILPELPNVCLESCHAHVEPLPAFERISFAEQALLDGGKKPGDWWEEESYPNLSPEMDELYRTCRQLLNRNIPYMSDIFYVLLLRISIFSRKDPLCGESKLNLQDPLSACFDLVADADELDKILKKQMTEKNEQKKRDLNWQALEFVEAILEKLRRLLCGE